MPKKRLFKAFFWKKCPKNNFFETFFLLRKKTSLSLSTFASSKQGSMGERLKPAHCYRAEPKGSEGSNPSASALWLVSSVGLEHDATNVGVGSSSLSRVTILEVGQSWSIAPVLKTGRRQRLKGSNPLASANLPYRITVVRQILDLQEVVRFHPGQHQ